MRYYIGLISILFVSSQIGAQNTVKMSAVKSSDYGVAYSLPKTALSLTIHFTKTVKKAGEFYQYAERYLNIPNPITQDETIYTLDKVEAKTIGLVDKSKSYLVEFKSNTLAPFVTLTEDGLICAINDDVKLTPNKETENTSIPTDSKPMIDPKSILSEEILKAGSSSKEAELIAKQIYLLRQSRTDILTGQADKMPPDGNAYKMTMDQLDINEKSLTSLFVGTEDTTTGSKTIQIPVNEGNINKQIVFRFSSKLGIVDTNDLAGDPVRLSLTNKETKEAPVLSDKDQKAMEKKFESGIIYNIPGKGDLKLEFKNDVLVQKTCDIVQYGTQEVLTPKMFDNNKQPIKVIFYPELGAVKQIIQ